MPDAPNAGGAPRSLKLTREQAAVIGAFTGVATGPFSVIHEYAEQVLGRPIWTHEFADKKLLAELKAAAKADFVSICFQEEADVQR